MSTHDRRAFHQATLGSLLTYALLETVLGQDAVADAMKPVTATWLAELDAMSRDLKGGKLSQPQWQEQVERLLARADLADLMRFIEFEKLARAGFGDRGERSLRFKFPQVEGLPTNLVFGHQVFALREGQSVVPHGHNNMATAFLVMQGKFRGRHYDRLDDTKTHMIIRPTIDRRFTAGEYSTVTDLKDNVHWFRAAEGPGYIFNIHVLNIKPGRTGRVYIDPNGEKLSDGRIRAPRIDAVEAYKRYGQS